ncbi:MAG TPA: EAL domain-containing protein [Solimonas sp.]|nr:EAL domain-containing protein [Solimonas sp.]
MHLVSQSVLPTVSGSDSQPWLEVFVRIEDDDGHWLEPQHFLRAVEHAGEVDRLDAAVLQQILAACRGRADIWERYEAISVNVSVHSLHSERYLSRAVELVKEYGIEPGRLAVEVDHGVRSEDLNRALPGIEMLARAGIRLVIDGCTDTRVLRLARSLRPAMVKVSPALIDAARLDPVADAELQAVITTARVLGSRLSAKNVDRVQDGPKLAALGFELYQGRGIEAMGPLLH